MTENTKGRKEIRPINKVVAIIPVFDEDGLFGQILFVLRDFACLKEIIVVDDGSTDGTYSGVSPASLGVPAHPS